jgi:hypothetical protein
MEIGMIFAACAVVGVGAGFAIRWWIGRQSPMQRRAKLVNQMKAEDSKMWEVCNAEMIRRRKAGIH